MLSKIYNRSNLKQFIKFGIVGFTNTIIAYGVYAILVYFGIYYQIANICAFIASSINGFLINKFWVFKSRSNKVPQFFRYYAIYLTSLSISIALSWLWIDVLNINKYISPILNLSVTIPFNYLFSRFWVYKKISCTIC